MHWKPLAEDASAYLGMALFLVFAITTLVPGFATNRHKNHRVRLRAKARRRLARRTSPA